MCEMSITRGLVFGGSAAAHGGKPLAFRISNYFHGGYASASRVESNIFGPLHGKAEPYRHVLRQSRTNPGDKRYPLLPVVVSRLPNNEMNEKILTVAARRR